MALLVKSFDTKLINRSEYPSAADLKVYLAQQDGLPLDSMELYNGTSLLNNDLNLTALPENCTIDVSVPLLGGKVHGSLTRAGKVRSQTPKVPKQEKKKKCTGRAKRRIQYNKRFLAVTTQFGARRRGPNSNVKA